MAHLLYKPHIDGPKGIVTPDLLIDRVTVIDSTATSLCPIQRFSMDCELQATPETFNAIPGVLIVAAGAGSVLAPALAITATDAKAAIIDVAVGRAAWRFQHITEQMHAINLAFSNQRCPLDHLIEPTAPEPMRGTAQLRLARALDRALTPSAVCNVRLEDSCQNRSIEHNIRITSVAEDYWPARPGARYTVGPVEPVDHYV